MLKVIYDLFFGSKPKYKKVLAPNNYKGKPPWNMEYGTAKIITDKTIDPKVEYIIPTYCPKCDKSLFSKNSDYAKIKEKSVGEYLVKIVYCTEGNYTHVSTS